MIAIDTDVLKTSTRELTHAQLKVYLFLTYKDELDESPNRNDLVKEMKELGVSEIIINRAVARLRKMGILSIGKGDYSLKDTTSHQIILTEKETLNLLFLPPIQIRTFLIIKMLSPGTTGFKDIASYFGLGRPAFKKAIEKLMDLKMVQKISPTKFTTLDGE
jgi:DNA-binding MarR family transcriptional regulator